jgi:hypothetical protein
LIRHTCRPPTRWSPALAPLGLLAGSDARGVDAPMPVILLRALGGMAASGILGMFVRATLLALGCQVFMGWIAANPEGAGPTDGDRRSPARPPPASETHLPGHRGP